MSYRIKSRFKGAKNKVNTMRSRRSRPRPKKKNTLLMLAVVGIFGFVVFKFKDKIKGIFLTKPVTKVGG